MFERKYGILLQTQIGPRSGTLVAQIEGSQVRGYLDVLTHSEPFEGNIDENGYCCINGKIVTLIKTIPFTATGRMEQDYLELSLNGGRNKFQITGTSLQE